VGAGPAGIATAIQLKRYGYDPGLFEMDRIGGLLWNANFIENYPGFPKGISGPQLIHLMEKQMWNLEIKVIDSYVEELDFDRGIHELSVGRKSYESEFVVIASGTKPLSIPMNVPEELKLRIHQNIVNLLGVCEKHIIIIGSGDAAFDQAINLSRNNTITILNRNGQTNALPLLVERALANKKISYLLNINVYNIEIKPTSEKDAESPLIIHCKSGNKGKITMECDEVVFAIGREPRLDFCKNIMTNEFCYMAGDVKNGIYRQVSIATGDGIMTAMKIHEIISARK